MSGGVDSSVAAALLVRAGYEVVGCFMRLGTPGESLEGPEEARADAASCPAPAGGPLRIVHRGCCSIADAADARLVAAELGIPLYVCNFKREFGRVIDYFVDEYARGRTPNPCVRCNDWLKFGRLGEYARQLGAAFIASGHYARVLGQSLPIPIAPGADSDEHARSLDGGGGVPRLARAVDESKDQSYVLFGVPRIDLARLVLPVGWFPKSRVRELAREMGLPVFDKPDSQEICFVPDDDYAALVEARRPDLARPGEVVSESGEVLGAHAGQHRFTVGQRRGVGIASRRPLFVLSRDPASNRVVVGERDRLGVSRCTAHEVNWLCDPPAAMRWTRVLARYRSNGPAVPAEVRVGVPDTAPTPSGRTGTFEVRFAHPQPAVAPGQAVVLYSPDEPAVMLGGGWIAGTARAEPVERMDDAGCLRAH